MCWWQKWTELKAVKNLFPLEIAIHSHKNIAVTFTKTVLDQTGIVLYDIQGKFDILNIQLLTFCP